MSDLYRATRFYEAVFGKPLLRERVDGYVTAMFAGVNGPEGALVKGSVYVPGKAGPIFYFSVSDFDAVLERATKLGAKLYRGPLDREDGTYMCQVKDLDGNLIGFIGPRYSVKGEKE